MSQYAPYMFRQIVALCQLGNRPFAARHKAVKLQVLEPYRLAQAQCNLQPAQDKIHRSASLSLKGNLQAERRCVRREQSVLALQ